VNANSKKIKDFLGLYYSLENASEFQKFMYSSRASFCVTLEIAEAQYRDSASSFEKICLNIPRNLGSRATIQNILTSGLKESFFIKVRSKVDKRIKNIQISQGYLKYVDTWVKMHTGIFDPGYKIKSIKNIKSKI